MSEFSGNVKKLPEGLWFRRYCCCKICGESNFEEDDFICSEEDNFILTCSQCELQYHVGCLRKQMHVMETHLEGIWFCSTQCEKIFFGLKKLLGRPIPVGEDNLSWTLLKPITSSMSDMDEPDIESSTEVYNKLNSALNVMHQCFGPIEELYTGRDLVADVIFCRKSDVKCLNFQGFYTVLLERNNELISVATIRVFGEKLAEVPLVGTQRKFRRLGMCRILINEIEKKLMELGVEWLTLPAAPGVMDTWISSFGFSKMTDPDKLKFLNYTLLNFNNTIMCQKLLMTKSSQSTAPWLNHDIESDRRSAESEVIQIEHFEEVEVAMEYFLPLGCMSCGQCLDEDVFELLPRDENHDDHSLEGLLEVDAVAAPWLDHDIESDSLSAVSEVVQTEHVEEVEFVAMDYFSPLACMSCEQCLDEDVFEFRDESHEENSLEGLLEGGGDDERGLIRDDKGDKYCFEAVVEDGDEDDHCFEGLVEACNVGDYSFVGFFKDESDDELCLEGYDDDDERGLHTEVVVDCSNGDYHCLEGLVEDCNVDDYFSEGFFEDESDDEQCLVGGGSDERGPRDDNGDKHCFEVMVEDGNGDHHCFEVLVEDGGRDDYCFEGFFKDDGDDEQCLESLLEYENGDGDYYRCSKRRRIWGRDS